MGNDEYKALGLYEHNIRSFEKVKDAFLNGQDVVGIVHATGTGKSFIALQTAYESPDANILYVVPSVSIIEHLKEIIEENPNLSLEKDFPNLKFITYQGLTSMKNEEMEEIECDLLILDEFHHIGAPVWGVKVNEMLETHPEMKIFGMTAYTVRDRGTSFERDMANPDTKEIFSNNIVSKYDLEDAIIEGVLPKPIYKSAYFDNYLLDYAASIETSTNNSKITNEQKKEFINLLNNVKRRIHEAPSLPVIFKKNLKEDGKYIYFCPPVSEDGVNDIETIKNQTIEMLKEFIPEDQIEVYVTTADMGKDGKLNREAFYHDKTINGEDASGKFRIMFAINQYNEGVHAPNIDGVIMGRGTSSDIVFFEHLGRALSVRGNTEEKYNELDKYTYEELIDMCNDKDIKVEEGTSKKEVIEKLLAPMILDLTNNYGYMIELQDNLQNRIKEKQEKGLGNERNIKIDSVMFDIEIENKELFDLLEGVRNRLRTTWNDYYDLAKAYYEHRGFLDIPKTFKTTNGYEKDEHGLALGKWLQQQKDAYNGIRGSITKEQIELLEQIGISWKEYDFKWFVMYNYAKSYYEKEGNLDIPYNYILSNDEIKYPVIDGRLGAWINNQKIFYTEGKLSNKQIELLDKIGMNWEISSFENIWMRWYNLAKAYYEHHGNLDIKSRFKTVNGYEYDKRGVALGNWITRQRYLFNNVGGDPISNERIELLNKIGMRWENVDNMDTWMQWYNLAKAYYEHYGNLEIPVDFKTTNGIEEDPNGVNLGAWITTQRGTNKGQKAKSGLSETQKDLLNQIGMRWDNINLMDKWMQWYNLAKIYYEHHGNLEIPGDFKTTNGYEEDPNGVKLGSWLYYQRGLYKNGGTDSISNERINLLNQIGMCWNKNEDKWMNMYILAKAYYEHHGNLDIAFRFKTTNGYEEDPNGVALGTWLRHQKDVYNGAKDIDLSPERIHLLEQIGINWFEEKNDYKYQTEEINDLNKDRKEREILNRVKSSLLSYDGSTLPSKEEINSDLMDRLNRIK